MTGEADRTLMDGKNQCGGRESSKPKIPRSMRLLALALAALAIAAPLRGQQMIDGQLTLADAIDLALRNSPTMAMSYNDLDVERWNVRNAYGDLLPSAQASSSMSWQGAGEQQFGSITARDLGFADQPSFYLSRYSIGVNYSLSGQAIMAPGQAKRNQEATRARIAGEEAQLRLNITQLYLDVVRQEEARALAERELERARLDVQLAQGRLDVGSATVIDLRQAELSVGRAQVALLRAEAAVETARIRLFQRMGVDLASTAALATTFEIAQPDWDVDELYAIAIGRNPDLTSLRATEEASRYGVRMARASYYPSLSISTGFSGFTRQASNTAAQEAQAVASARSQLAQCVSINQILTRLADPLPEQDCSGFAVSEEQLEAIRANNRTFPFGFTRNPPSASISLSLPVFQGLSKQRGLEAAKAQLSDNRHRVREKEIALRADIRAQLAVVQMAFESQLIEERNQELADEQLRLEQERYRLGLSNFIALAEAVTVKARADREIIAGIFAYHDAIADLEAVVGVPLRTP